MISKDKAERESKEQLLIEKYMRKDKADRLWLERLNKHHERRMDAIRKEGLEDLQKLKVISDEIGKALHEWELELERHNTDCERIKSVEFLKGYNFGKLGVK